MRILRRFVTALVLAAICGPLAPSAGADNARRRHPRPRPNHGQRHYRPYRPYYPYPRPYRHYRSAWETYTCRVWIRGYWDYDEFGEFWEPGHYGYVPCR